jgi:hypothetical protein
LLIALGLVLSTGFLHGIWIERWRKSEEPPAAVARLDGLPERVGDWQASSFEMDPRALQQAGAEGHWLRRFTHARTGTAITIILLCGRTGQMAAHRPEHCYRGAGYETSAPAAKCAVPLGPAEPPADFWTARFRKDDATGPVQLRIFWSWLADDSWRAPDSPRLAFAGVPVLYKLYAVRELQGLPERVEEDPCLDLLGSLIPVLTKSLSSPQPPE